FLSPRSRLLNSPPFPYTTLFRSEGFIRDYSVVAEEGKPQPTLKVELSYSGRKQPVLTGLQRVSKPGLRVYVQKREIPRVYGGLGDRKSTRLNSSHRTISYAVFCL